MQPCSDQPRESTVLDGGTSFAELVKAMSRVQMMYPAEYQAQVWDCLNQNQVLSAAFEVHEAAMKAGFMPDEATMLSLSLAELCAQSASSTKGAVASVFFSDAGWRLEVTDSGPAELRSKRPQGNAAVPKPLASLRARTASEGTVAIAEYARDEHA